MLKVYFVDDAGWLLSELKSIIDWEHYGYTVSGFNTDPLAAKDEIIKLNPDLVISDIHMDSLDGLTLAAQIHAVNTDISFCFLSAYDRFDYAVSAIKLGAVDYLTKPIKTDSLLDVLKRVKDSKTVIADTNSGNEDISGGQHEQNSVVASIIRDIEQGVGNRHSLSRYAEKYGYNVSYLSVLFKKTMGKSFVDYVVDRKILTAKNLILKSCKTMLEISGEVGYDDYFHFSKQFKQHTGMSPSEFRNRFVTGS